MSKMPYRIIKRVSDIFLSLLLLLILSPILLSISLLIYLIDKGDIFVKDPLRLGKGGKEFRMYKFRSMVPNAHQEILSNPKYKELKKKWEANGNKLKIEEDSRITLVGRFLRRTDFDELPQLINVLLGHMSLIGPRPTYKDEVERYLNKHPKDERYFRDIFSVRPGITGVWQVSGRNSIDFKNRLVLDSQYAKNLNMLDDLKIFFKTPYIVFTRKGAYE
jgi:undecaprenyl-phosphate galactose phosphotransferase